MGDDGDYRRGGRRDYDRRDHRDNRDRERSREKDRERSRSYNDHHERRDRSDRSDDAIKNKSASNISSNLGTEDWSDDDIADIGNEEPSTDVHKNVAEELANFDKKFLPSGNN